MLPTASDLDDPDGFVHREQLDFSEIDKMLGEAALGGLDKPNLSKEDDSKGDGPTDGPKGDSEDDEGK
jgi:hypothetical protein